MAASLHHAESAAERPLRLAARRDLAVFPMEFRGRRYWHLKDPVSLRYYQLRDEEHFVWGLLNGQRSLHDILTLSHARFAPRRLEMSHLHGFLSLLHREGRVTAEASDQGDRLLERARQKRREAWYALLTNPLAIRFRGFNPDGLLGWLNRRLSALFRPGLLVLLAACLLGAGMLLIPHWGEFISEMPNSGAFFRGDNLLWLAVALAFVKIVHELAHGLTCKHFGAECTELGLLLLVFTPCLYCNVSDAWTLPNKWQRMLVSAAGILAELGLAALATFVWRWTEPGALHALSVRVVLICSVSTLLLNGNPLMRYDGYYLLSDWLEIPNLQSQAADALRRLASRLFLGVDLSTSHLEPASISPGLALYGLASLLYRVVVLAAVIWFLYSALVHNGFPALGGLLVLVATAVVATQLVRRAVRWTMNPWEHARIRMTRRSCASVFVVVGLLLFCLAPLPCRVSAPAVLRPRDLTAVYATVAGQLVTAAEEGQWAARGTVLAELHNHELAREIQSLVGQQAVQLRHITNLRRQQFGDPQVAAELLAAEKTLQAIEGQLAEQRLLEARLTIRSPSAGVVLPPPDRTSTSPHGMLPSWSGSPLQSRNRGAYIEAGTLLCHVGDPRHLEAVVVVEPSQVELVQVGQRVQVYLAGGPAVALPGEVIAISEMNIDAAPPELVSTGDLPVQPEFDRRGTLSTPYYQAVVRLEPNSTDVLPGLVGRARIKVANQSLFTRFRRLLGQTLSIAD